MERMIIRRKKLQYFSFLVEKDAILESTWWDLYFFEHKYQSSAGGACVGHNFWIFFYLILFFFLHNFLLTSFQLNPPYFLHRKSNRESSSSCAIIFFDLDLSSSTIFSRQESNKDLNWQGGSSLADVAAHLLRWQKWQCIRQEPNYRPVFLLFYFSGSLSSLPKTLAIRLRFLSSSKSQEDGTLISPNLSFFKP